MARRQPLRGSGLSQARRQRQRSPQLQVAGRRRSRRLLERCDAHRGFGDGVQMFLDLDPPGRAVALQLWSTSGPTHTVVLNLVMVRPHAKLAAARPSAGTVRWCSSARSSHATYVVACDGPSEFATPFCCPGGA